MKMMRMRLLALSPLLAFCLSLRAKVVRISGIQGFIFLEDDKRVEGAYLFGQIELGSRSIQREPKGLLRFPLVTENYTMPIFLYIMCIFYFIYLLAFFKFFFFMINRLYTIINKLFIIINYFYVVVSNIYTIINKLFIKKIYFY